jgi:hypothetical protein
MLKTGVKRLAVLVCVGSPCDAFELDAIPGNRDCLSAWTAVVLAATTLQQACLLSVADWHVWARMG